MLVTDNLKAAVKRADWCDPELNPKIESFARHYGTMDFPTRVCLPHRNGKVEGSVGYVKGNALRFTIGGQVMGPVLDTCRGWAGTARAATPAQRVEAVCRAIALLEVRERSRWAFVGTVHTLLTKVRRAGRTLPGLPLDFVSRGRMV